ncbi:hypothetical protein [Rheinheimera tilapiae]|uniref:Uncharacterized protein n=1 Tax=Rheinheimera tilapiae TaxID=875043 RepID=A0ABV6BCI7_9GAMM
MAVFQYGNRITVLLLLIYAATVQSKSSYYLLERFDKPLDNIAVESQGSDSLVIYGEDLDLTDITLESKNKKNKSTQDIIIVAKTIKLGGTEIYLDGQFNSISSNYLNGGDFFLVADKIIIGSLPNNQNAIPLVVYQKGGRNFENPEIIQSRDGRTHIFVNKVEFDEDLKNSRISFLNVSGDKNGPIPFQYLKMISRSFSPTNSVHKVIKEKKTILWEGFGLAYLSWLNEEPIENILAKELNLVSHRIDPNSGNNIPDVVGSMKDATKYLPDDILSPWYLSYIQRKAALATAAVGNKDYELALNAVRKANLFTTTAPASAMTSANFNSAIKDLDIVQKMLTVQSIVEEIYIPTSGGPSQRVTIIRDRAEGSVSVVPNLVLLSTFQENNKLRIGFMSVAEGDVLVNLYGRMTVDPSVLEFVRSKFPSSSEVRIADDLEYDTLNLGLGDIIKNGNSKVLDGTNVKLDLLVSGTSFRQMLLRLSQPFGVEVSVSWKHPRLSLANQTARLNLSLGRTESSIVAKNGELTNTSSDSIDVNYVIDGKTVITNGFPIRIAAGESIQLDCSNELCYAPGAAISRLLLLQDIDSWLVSLPSGSSVMSYTFENHLESDPYRGGNFEHLVLEVNYVSAPGATPQKTGPFILGGRGTVSARRNWSFIGSSLGVAKIEISGRAFWQYGYYDISTKTISSTLTIIDEGWIKQKSPAN